MKSGVWLCKTTREHEKHVIRRSSSVMPEKCQTDIQRRRQKEALNSRAMRAMSAQLEATYGRLHNIPPGTSGDNRY